ncbi:hypothetical protein ASG65_19080 [Bacillus sp. Leaf13]|nr:hypothetical protein ASG65_19080 [Bacillus sp. Leaf13]
MKNNKKEVALPTEQPTKEFSPTINVPQDSVPFDFLDEELQKEAQTLALPETPLFPVKFFPPPIERFINDAAKALSCPPDFVAMGVLVCASVAIGNGAVLELKNSWVTSSSLYCGIVAEPGSAKTPAISIALKPLFKIQQRNFEEYESLKCQYELEQENYEIEFEKWKQKAGKKNGANIEDKPEQPKKPVLQQLVTMDSTMEALQEILLFNQRGVVKLHDELLGYFKSMNQYRAGADRQYWLSIWSNEPIIINRKGKEPIQIPKPFVSILGGIQPDVIEEIVQAGSEGSGTDGFIDRFLLSYPDSVSSNWTDEDVSEEVMDGYCDIINSLYHSLNATNPKVIYFDKKAKEAYTMWYDLTEAETITAGFPETLKGVWKKIKGQHPRILLIMHMLKCTYNSQPEQGDLIVEEETVIYTNYIMEYFKAHTKKVFQFTQANLGEKNAIKLMEYVRRKGEKQEKGFCIRVNSLNRGKVFGRNTNIKIIEETIEHIEGQGLGESRQSIYKNNPVSEFILYENTI